MTDQERKQYPPEMHTAEHILNQTMVRMFNRGRSFSNHIEKKKSKCDYYFDRDLTSEEVKSIEDKVNTVIRSAMPVKEELISREDASGKYNLSRLPEGSRDMIRIIRIGEYDACPCIGQHVHNTAEIGSFRIISTSYSEGVLRIRFRIDDK
ncbi:MAG: hypothetical protein Kow0098_01530 [Ignavibacteriaceae bacterium]